MIHVLIECSAALTALDLAEELAAAGFAVTTCSGSRGRGGCPLLRGERCAGVATADVVVNALDGAQLETYVAARTLHRDVPVVLLTEGWRAEALDALVGGVVSLPSTAGGDEVVAAIWAATEDRSCHATS